MYQYTPFFTNPAEIGSIEDVRVAVNYRNQSLDADANFTLSSVSGYYPIPVGNHRLVVAANFMNDKVTNYLSTNGGLVTAAYSLKVSHHAELSLGLQGGYMFQKTSGSYTTSDQYVNGAFDPTIVSADASLTQSVNYPTLSIGAYYRTLDDDRNERALIGVSFFNMNLPNTSITREDDERMPVSFKLTAGYRVYSSDVLSIMPTARWIHYADNDFANLGSRFSYAINQPAQDAKK